jgi:TetR/AcrR family transcriptional regulator, regulator of cefoperazone and chloramphenicol sensitivity
MTRFLIVDEARLNVFALVAQIVYFRIARAPVLMRMGWSEIGQSEAAAIESVVLCNLEAAIEAARRRAS